MFYGKKIIQKGTVCKRNYQAKHILHVIVAIIEKEVNANLKQNPEIVRLASTENHKQHYIQCNGLHNEHQRT